MTQEERLIQIKQLLKKKHQLSTRQIAAHFNVSFDTARRDVIHLTETGQAIRVHGGLMEINCNSVPDFLARNPVSYTHLTLPTTLHECRSRWSPYH